MNRRSFVRKLAGAAGAAGVAGVAPLQALPAPPAVRAEAGHASPAPYKVSLMLWTVFPHLRFEERLEKVAEAGYHAVELVNEFRQWSAPDYRRVLQKKHELGLEFDASAGLSRSLVDPRQRPAFLKELQDMIPILDKLECSTLIILPGDCVPGMSRVDQYQSCVDALKQAAELIEGKNVRVLIENIDPEENPRFYMTSVAEGFEIVRTVNHPQIRALYDLYHEQIAAGNLIEKLEKNIDLTGLIHIADVPGRHEPGTGEINYHSIYKKLGQLKYDRYLAMEYFPTYDPIESLRANRQMALRDGNV